MKKINSKRLLMLILPAYLLTGCSKDYTRYYADGEVTGIAIFSNTNNNIMSCFIAGEPWRTVSRTTSGFNPRTSYEVDVLRSTGNFNDTLLIVWRGYFTANENNQGNLTLHLTMPLNFTFRNLTALQGQRLSIDTSTGYFSTSISGINPSNVAGKGHIYFHTARFDSIAPAAYTGNISGIFEADFTSFMIKKGSFDHLFASEQIHF